MPIGSPWQIRRISVGCVDRNHAEPVRLSFFANGKVDPNRAATEIAAVLHVGEGKEPVVSGLRTDKSWRSRIQAQGAELHIDRAKYPDVACKDGDKVRALMRPGQPWFEVLAVDDRNPTRLVLKLGEI